MSPDEIAREIVQKVICTNIHTGKEWLAEGYGYPDMLRKEIAAALSTERTAREKAEAVLDHTQMLLRNANDIAEYNKERLGLWMARAEKAEAERDAWQGRESETQDALQAIGDEYGVFGGEPRTSGIARVLAEWKASAQQAEYELTRWKEVQANKPDWEKLWAEQVDAREKAEAEREIDYARIAASQVKAAREAALREAAEFIRVQRNETPATGEEFAVALLAIIPKQERET